MERGFEDTFTEGKAALALLDAQLKDKSYYDNDNLSTGSKQRSTERRLLDQSNRDVRLQNRTVSSIGSLGELDDRGLLQGGGYVCVCVYMSIYTSRYICICIYI
jgi:hypothetical protein